METAILMLVYLNLAMDRHRQMAEREGRGLSRANPEAAIEEGALLRLRPKMMTVITIFAGLMPLPGL